MATGGIFQLITNDGKQDRLLMATALLNKRLRLIEATRAKDPNVDPTPTLLDIERTHLLFVNAHFKPFASIGFEYNKVNPLHRPSSLSNSSTTDLRFPIPQFGDFFHDMCLHLVLIAPTLTITGTPYSAGRWAEYPGERIMKKTEFNVNGNLLDGYTGECYSVYRNHLLGNNKINGYSRMMGQQIPRKGKLRQTAGSVADTVESYQAQINILEGAQTYKRYMDDLELYIPLMFWFNKDPRLAIPSVSIPHGHRYVDITLSSRDDLIMTDRRGNANTLTIGNVDISKCQLYINNIFVNPEVHDIFIKRIGFSLIRVHRIQELTCNNTDDEILLNNMKWPIECMIIGAKMNRNKVINNYHHLFTDVDTLTSYKLKNVVGYGSTNFTGGIVEPTIDVEAPTAILNTLTISAHGIPIYDNFDADFYNSYLPTVQGGSALNPAEDRGLLYVGFCLYPNSYQPSGHINVSRAREFYLRYTSSIITDSDKATIYCIASALNFLLISDGSAVLRYST